MNTLFNIKLAYTCIPIFGCKVADNISWTRDSPPAIIVTCALHTECSLKPDVEKWFYFTHNLMD